MAIELEMLQKHKGVMHNLKDADKDTDFKAIFQKTERGVTQKAKNVQNRKDKPAVLDLP
jgi:hypothetical protein